MSHNVRQDDGGTVIVSGSEPTLSPITTVAVGGLSWIMLSVENTGGAPIAVSGQSISGSDSAHYTLVQQSRSSIQVSGGENDQCAMVLIAFQPTSSGTKNAQFNITVESTEYAIPLQGTPGSAAVAIAVVDGVSPAWGREAPCVIVARVDMDNTVLPAPFAKCYFKWTVTPPGEQQLLSVDRRTYGNSTERNLYSHYPGCAIAIPVLEGEHGTWKLDLDVHVPGDDGNSPSLSASQVSVVVDALGTNKTTYYASASGAGSHNGTQGNEWSWSEAETNLTAADDWHLILTANETYVPTVTEGFDAAGDNWSVVGLGSGSNRPRLRPKGVEDAAFTVAGRGGWLQNIIFEPYQGATGADGNAIIFAYTSHSNGVYGVTITGDGVTPGEYGVSNSTHNGSSFNNGIVAYNQVPVGFAQSADVATGIGLFFLDVEATFDYGQVGYANTLVEVNCVQRCSTNESCFRSLGVPNYTIHQHDYGYWFYNAVDTKHEQDEDIGIKESKQTWRFRKGIYHTLHRCVSSGELWLQQKEDPSGSGLTLDVSIRQCDLLGNEACANGIVHSHVGAHGNSCASCFVKRTHTNMNDSSIGLRANSMWSWAHCTLWMYAGAVSYHLFRGYQAGDGEPNTVTSSIKSCITISDVGSTWNVFSRSNGEPWTGADCIANNVFNVADNGVYEVNNTTYSTVSLLNASAVASSNEERDITLDATGRPVQNVSGKGRVDWVYYDYHMRAMTDLLDWAGMAQAEDGSGPTSARVRLRIRPLIA